MVVCIIAAVVFGILALFSVKYRPLAKEAFSCVFRLVTFRPCESDFGEKMKARAVAKTMKRFPKVARILNKYFEVFSWVLTLLMIASFALFAIGVYNYVAYGNCNGPSSPDVCIFDEIIGNNPKPLIPVAPGVGPVTGPNGTTVVEFGCFTCPRTREAQPVVKQLLAQKKIKLEFRFFPIAAHAHSHEAASVAACMIEEEKFWEYHDLLFEKNLGDFSNETLVNWAVGLGANRTLLEDCFTSGRGASIVNRDIDAGKDAGIYGTPTFFIGDQQLIGPRKLSEFYDVLAGKVSGGAVCTAK